MGVPYTLLLIWFAVHLLQPGHCLSEYHGILTDDELHSYTKKEQIKAYDIISPKIHDPSKLSKRSIDSTNHNEPHKVTFTAFDEEHHVVLERNRWLLRPDLEVEYLQPDGSIRKEPVQTRDCHFFATSISHGGSKGALSTCSGLRGVLSVNDEMLFIEPLRDDHARRMKRESDDDTTRLHLIYKRDPANEEDSLCPIGDFPVADSGGSTGTVTPGNETVYTGPYLGAKYVELFVTVDKLVYDDHLTETESYVTTIMNIMSRRYADPSLDISMRFSLVRLLISMTTTITANNPSGGQESFTPVAAVETTLPDFCTWQAALSVNDDTDPNDWDLALFFTGHDIYRGSLDFSLLGQARLGGTCNLNNKCSVNENIGLSSALVMAHETGHNFDLSHDGVYGCTEGLNIMSTSLTRSAGAFEWSSCSSEHMKIFISSQVCMDDIPSSALLSITELPGQNYTLDQQCQINTGNPDAFSCISFTTCLTLWCGMPGSNTCTSSSQPAEGSPCGGGLWCINAACVNMSLETSPAVNGGWTEYGDLTSCSRTCGTGVQYRRRFCTNPTPRWGGAPCVGDSHMYMLCNEQPCPASQDDYRDEQCAATNSTPLNGQCYSWIDDPERSATPMLGDALCSLTCLSTDINTFYDRPGNFHDGTLCWDDAVSDVKTTKMCLHGRCRNFGCDGVLDSGLVYDDCRVCNGDGSSCSCTSETLTSASTAGESVIATVPIGSTSISADSYGNSFAGLRVNDTFIFGIDTSIGNVLTLGGRYIVGNMIVNYDRIFQVETHLRSLTEPSTETLEILLWTSSSSNVNITYRYCTPANDPCNTSPCQNGGTCSSSGSTYTCQCPSSHEGTNCENDTKEGGSGIKGTGVLDGMGLGVDSLLKDAGFKPTATMHLVEPVFSGCPVREASDSRRSYYLAVDAGFKPIACHEVEPIPLMVLTVLYERSARSRRDYSLVEDVGPLLDSVMSGSFLAVL